jgi:hypothetical protein
VHVCVHVHTYQAWGALCFLCVAMWQYIIHTFSLIGREVGWCSMFLMFRCFDVLIGSFIQIRVNAKKDLRPSLLTSVQYDITFGFV